METVCIIHGLNEGPAMSRHLEEALRREGFQIISDPSAADIIFAHSGGCFLVPADAKATKIFLVGLPYWPGRPWIISTIIKVAREAKIYWKTHSMRSWATKWSYHCRYAFHLRPAIRMGLNMGLGHDWNSERSQIIIRNRHDAYASPDLLDIDFRGPRTFISLPGEHDDCWDNPEPYVAIIRSFAEGRQ